jgi:ribosomal protein L11 methyltransferase
MQWIETNIYTTTEGIEPLCGRLYAVGLNGVQIKDAADFNDFIENETQYWDYIDESLEPLKSCETCVTVYLTDDADGRELLSHIRGTVAELKALDSDGRFGRLAIELSGINEEDWANNWKKYYKPFKLGKRLLIKPEWETVVADADSVVLSMNPGHLFGTGTHHSTQLCMVELEKYVRQGDRVLDLGCGSGILSILSLLLGAESAVAVDIDPAAPATAMENLAMNGIAPERYRVLVGNVIDDTELRAEIGGGYDVVVANIVADVIIAMSATAYAQTRQGGMFITSGIIGPRGEEVKAAMTAAGFDIVDVHEQNDWLCITAKKN